MYCIRATYIPQDDMWFDREHYASVHVPLARAQLEAANVQFVRLEAEFDQVLLDDQSSATTPCIFSLYVDTWEDVEDFQAFRQGPYVEPLREDLPKYTNCKNVWTVVEVISG